jgi:hypothetical protein
MGTTTTKMPKIQCKHCERMVSIERAIGGRCNNTTTCSARKKPMCIDWGQVYAAAVTAHRAEKESAK